MAKLSTKTELQKIKMILQYYRTPQGYYRSIMGLHTIELLPDSYRMFYIRKNTALYCIIQYLKKKQQQKTRFSETEFACGSAHEKSGQLASQD